MEFLDINLTKNSSIAQCYSQSILLAVFTILQKTILCSDFKIHTKNLCKKENLSLFLIAFCWTENNTRVENQKKLEYENARVYAQKPWLKMPFQNSISGHPSFSDYFFFLAACSTVSCKEKKSAHPGVAIDYCYRIFIYFTCMFWPDDRQEYGRTRPQPSILI